MVSTLQTECEKIEAAFRNATRSFSDTTVEILIYHLEERYNIRIGSTPCSCVEEIEAALLDITGMAADLVISRMRSFLR